MTEHSRRFDYLLSLHQILYFFLKLYYAPFTSGLSTFRKYLSESSIEPAPDDNYISNQFLKDMRIYQNVMDKKRKDDEGYILIQALRKRILAARHPDLIFEGDSTNHPSEAVVLDGTQLFMYQKILDTRQRALHRKKQVEDLSVRFTAAAHPERNFSNDTSTLQKPEYSLNNRQIAMLQKMGMMSKEASQIARKIKKLKNTFHSARNPGSLFSVNTGYKPLE